MTNKKHKTVPRQKIPNSNYAAYRKWITPEGLEKLKGIVKEHKIDRCIAKAMGITRDTLNSWKGKYPELYETIQDAKAEDDVVVESKLLQLCKGLKIEKTIVDNQGQTKTIYEELPPDFNSIRFFLVNRQPERWKNKIENEVNGAIPVVITGEDELKD